MKRPWKTWLILAGLSVITAACGREDLAQENSQLQEWQPRDEQRGLNFDAYCKRKFGQAFSAKMNGPRATDWACETDPNNRRPISVVEACQQQHNTSRVGVRESDQSWYCLVRVQKWVPVRVAVNLELYCRQKFGPNFHAVLNGNRPTDWACQTDPNNRRPISVVEACQQQQNTSKVGVANPNDPHSWYCER